MQRFGRSGTIFDPPPVQAITFTVGDPDLDEPLGGGWQAGFVRVTNTTNQALYLPDADDIVPANTTGIWVIKPTDVARASWRIPPKFALVQPAPIAGAAQLTFLNKEIEALPQVATAAGLTPAFPGSVVPAITLQAQGSGPGSPFLNSVITPPPGAQLQLIGTGTTFPVASAPTVKVTGNQTGFVYFSSALIGTIYISPQTADTSLTVTASGGPNTGLTVNSILSAIVVSSSPASGPSSWPGKYDGQVNNVPATGTQATVTLLASPTKRWVADDVDVSALQTGANVHLTFAHLIDGVSGGPNRLDSFSGGLVAGAGGSLNAGGSGRRYANAVPNTAMTLEFAGSAPSVQQSVSLGAYLQ